MSFSSAAPSIDDDDDEEDGVLNSNAYFSSGIKLQKAKPFNIDTSYLSHSASTQHNRYDRPKNVVNKHDDDDDDGDDNEDDDEPFRPSAPGIETFLSPPSSDGYPKPKGSNFLKRIPVGHVVKRKRRPVRRDQSFSESEVNPTKIRVENIDITTNRPKKIIPTTRRVFSKIVKREKVNVKLPNISTAPTFLSPTYSTPTTTTTTNTSTHGAPKSPSSILITSPSATSPAPSSKTPVTTINTDPHKRINYNYHPIIDFFEEEQEPNDPSDERYPADRSIGDRMGTGIRHVEQSWRPITYNVVDRRRLSGI